MRTRANLDLLAMLDLFMDEQYCQRLMAKSERPELAVIIDERRQHRVELKAFLRFLGRPAKLSDFSHVKTLRFREWLRVRFCRAQVASRFVMIRRLWAFLYRRGLVEFGPPPMGRSVCRIVPFHLAPRLPRLVEGPESGITVIGEVFLTPATSYGVTEADMQASLQAQMDLAEKDAWTMLRTCQTCRRLFAPAIGHRRSNPCCGRKCYLVWYRKVNAEQYRQSTRKWKESITGGT